VLSKLCTKCKLEKPISSFCKNKLKRDGLNHVCRLCAKKAKDKIREHCKTYKKKWYSENKEHIKEYNHRYRKANREKINKWVKSIPIEERRKWGNKEKKRERDRLRRQKPENRIKHRNYCRNKYKNDIQHRLTKMLRASIRAKIKKEWKSNTSTELLGCTTEFFKQYIESKFLPTMTWENQGTLWHLDHIKPCASFDLSDPSEQKKCFHYSNYQPLFATTRTINGLTYIGNLNKNRFIIDQQDMISAHIESLPTSSIQ
jgi:hypothetical protein